MWRIEVIWEKFNYLTPAVSGETDAHGLISTSTVDSLSRSLTLSLLTVQSVCCVCVCGLQRCKHKDYICYVPGPLSRHHRGQKEPTTPSQKHTHSHIHHRNPTASAAVHLTDTKPADIKQKGVFLHSDLFWGSWGKHFWFTWTTNKNQRRQSEVFQQLDYNSTYFNNYKTVT